MSNYVIYYENPEICDDTQAVWLRREGEPAPDPYEDGADYLLDPVRIYSETAALRWAAEEFKPEFAQRIVRAVCVGHGCR